MGGSNMKFKRNTLLLSLVILFCLNVNSSYASDIVHSAYDMADRLNEALSRSNLSWNDERLINKSLNKINGILNKYEQADDCYYYPRRRDCLQPAPPHHPPRRRPISGVDQICVEGLRGKQPHWPNYEVQFSCTNTDTRCVFAVVDIQKYWTSVELTGLCSLQKNIDKGCVINTVRHKRYTYASDIEAACSFGGHR